jgi:hypothetical protein
MEAAGDQLIDGRIRQHVARDLFDREAVERHVLIQRVDDPVAILPHHPREILFEALRVGIARQIEPRPRPPFAIMRRREQSIDEC